MNFTTSKYTIGDITVNKVSISDECWIMVYNNVNKLIITKPLKVSNFTFETIFDFCIKDTMEELMSAVKTLNLSFNK